MASIDGVGGTTSVVPMLTSMNRVLHQGEPAYDRLPNDVEVEQGFDYGIDDEGMAYMGRVIESFFD